uniref:Uncharacterized protein n=1 Tax=Desertifilum tharense IPPAS B-1220 TaxID=1781255 RepID=A0ACD5GST0_9CYAN
MEAVAETDDTLTEKYLEGEEFTEEEIRTALRKGTVEGTIVPMLCGSAFKNKGVQLLLDAVIDYLPAPVDVPPIQGTLPSGEVVERRADDEAPFSALAFKIMARSLRSPYLCARLFRRPAKRQLRPQLHQRQKRTDFSPHRPQS